MDPGPQAHLVFCIVEYKFAEVMVYASKIGYSQTKCDVQCLLNIIYTDQKDEYFTVSNRWCDRFTGLPQSNFSGPPQKSPSGPLWSSFSGPPHGIPLVLQSTLSLIL